MIAALVVAGLALIAVAVLGARIAAVRSPAARITMFGLGAALLLAAGTSVLLAGVRAPAQTAAEPQAAQVSAVPRVMVVGDDGPEGSFRRSDPGFQAALAAFEAELRRNGVAVSDGRTISTLNEAQDRARRPDGEIVQLARRQQRDSLDAVVLFSLFVRLEFGQGGPTLAGRSNTVLSGRGVAIVLRGTDSANIGVFESISPGRWPVGFDCARTCQLETTGAEAPIIAEALAGQVVPALKNALSR